MPTTPKNPKATKAGGRLYNLHQYNRFRLELPTGKMAKKNGQEFPITEVFWLLGQQDAEPDTKNSNFVDLTSEQVKAVRADKGLMELIRLGKLNLV